MSIGSDRFAALRSRVSGVPARCLPALLVAIGVLGVAGCGGSSHTANTTAAADVNGAVAGVGPSTATTGTSTTSSTSSDTPGTTTATSTASGQGQSNSSSSVGDGATGGAVKSGSEDPTSSHGGTSGKPSAKSRSKSTGKGSAGKSAAGVGTGSGAGAAGPGSGSSAGSGASAGSSAPSANTGIPYEVNTTSMEPTFQPETKIYYDPTRTHPQIGEVVVFYLPAGAEEGGACGEVMAGGRACTTPVPGLTKNKEMSFKRVVGLPGDTIAIREGHVIRNGQPEQPEPPTLPCEKDEKLNCEFPTPITVPAGSYYLMADNRGLYKEDSRLLGAIPQEYILGTVEGG